HRGPDTGRMGPYAPVSLSSAELLNDVTQRIFQPTLAALAAQGRPFTGLLYAGLMLTDGGPRVVEFNCRFGDPETQAVLPVARVSSPFPELLAMVARGEKLPKTVTCTAQGAAVTTVLAADGYPERPRQGAEIHIPANPEGVLVF